MRTGGRRQRTWRDATKKVLKVLNLLEKITVNKTELINEFMLVGLKKFSDYGFVIVVVVV